MPNRSPGQAQVGRDARLRAQRLPVAALEELRIQKALVLSGLGSRRECDAWVEAGRVEINRQTAQPGARVRPGDQVSVDGRMVRLRWPDRLPRIVLYHKPEGELVSRDDPEGRTTVFQRLPRLSSSAWSAVGRLDYNSSGLLIFTTSGELAHRLMHPRFEVEREYAVRILGGLNEEQIQALRTGVELEDGPAHLARLEAEGGEGANQWYRAVLREGRKREVRRLFAHFGLTVSRLIRVRFGPLILPPRLQRGKYHELSESEVVAVLRWAGLDLGGQPKAAGRLATESAAPAPRRQRSIPPSDEREPRRGAVRHADVPHTSALRYEAISPRPGGARPPQGRARISPPSLPPPARDRNRSADASTEKPRRASPPQAGAPRERAARRPAARRTRT